MSMRARLAGLLGLTCLLAAAPVQDDSARPVRENGLALNGVQVNGLALNAIFTNGLALNAVFTNGLALNAVVTNGLALNAMSINALTMNALDWNGLALNGFSGNGLALNGVQINGQTYNAVFTNALTNNGLMFGNGWELSEGVDLAEAHIEETELVATLTDGTVLRGTDWVGLPVAVETNTGDPLLLEVEAVEQKDGLTWYGLTFLGENVCGDGGLGLFVQGAFDETATRVDDEVYSFSCSTGALAKCVDWGYEPWEIGLDAHQTCTRAVRADYCGDGVSWTENGTLIDLYDDLGVWPFTGYGLEEGLSFEAGWSPDGAICRAKSRYLDVADRELPSCFDSLPRCSTWNQALELGAEIGNSSKLQVRIGD